MQPTREQLSRYAEILDKVKLSPEMRKRSFLYAYLKNFATQQEVLEPLRKEIDDLLNKIMDSKCFTCEKKTVHLDTKRKIEGLR